MLIISSIFYDLLVHKDIVVKISNEKDQIFITVLELYILLEYSLEILVF